jgi:shikimate dehydrogenase
MTKNLIKDNILKESVVKNGRIKATQYYAVFGNPIHHSKSPALHQAFAQQTGEDIQYTAELVDVDGFFAAADTFFASGGKGLNITVPFKINALQYADQLTNRAEKAGAVNTLIKKDNIVIGDNTDGVGFIDDIVNNLHWPLMNKKILILGAGGAVRGILGPLIQTNPEMITIANRTVEKAEQLLDRLTNNTSCHLRACHYDDINTSYDIIINGTSASLHGDLPQLPSTTITQDSYCYDMMYDKEPTIFMRWGKHCGAREVADGLGMLVCQGAESFYQWRGVKPQTQAVIKELRLCL